jgi:UDP-N-acetylmuramate dehydrogenase
VTARLERAETILRAACGERLRTDFAIAPLTTFRIGGPAALFLEAASIDDLLAVGEAVREADLPVVVVGKGSNVLVSDRGYLGLVLRLGRPFRWAARDGDTISAGAAMPLPALAGVALSHGLAGLEFGVAIPASLGGAVRMNAGAHGSELADRITSVDVFELPEGLARRMDAGEIPFAYRRSGLAGDAVVVSASIALEPGDPPHIRELMDEAREWRRRTQPLAEPNCGSVFKNPPGDHAARLIEASGGKSMSMGGARVSEKHANFIVASDGATATDVVRLIRALQEIVHKRFDVMLDPEVQLVGDLDLADR